LRVPLPLLTPQRTALTSTLFPYTTLFRSNVALEQLLGVTQSLTVTYAGAWGRNLLRRDTYVSPNADLPQGFYAIGNESYSNYNRSEEHTSELQSRFDLVCRLLLEKKKQQ